LEITFTITAFGPITFHGDPDEHRSYREKVNRAADVAKQLSCVRKRHFGLSIRGGVSKLVLDDLMRERLRLQAQNSLWFIPE
jgi:hypothetical protein